MAKVSLWCRWEKVLLDRPFSVLKLFTPAYQSPPKCGASSGVNFHWIPRVVQDSLLRRLAIYMWLLQKNRSVEHFCCSTEIIFFSQRLITITRIKFSYRNIHCKHILSKSVRHLITKLITFAIIYLHNCYFFFPLSRIGVLNTNL